MFSSSSKVFLNSLTWSFLPFVYERTVKSSLRLIINIHSTFFVETVILYVCLRPYNFPLSNSVKKPPCRLHYFCTSCSLLGHLKLILVCNGRRPIHSFSALEGDLLKSEQRPSEEEREKNTLTTHREEDGGDPRRDGGRNPRPKERKIEGRRPRRNWVLSSEHFVLCPCRVCRTFMLTFFFEVNSKGLRNETSYSNGSSPKLDVRVLLVMLWNPDHISSPRKPSNPRVHRWLPKKSG